MQIAQGGLAAASIRGSLNAEIAKKTNEGWSQTKNYGTTKKSRTAQSRTGTEFIGQGRNDTGHTEAGAGIEDRQKRKRSENTAGKSLRRPGRRKREEQGQMKNPSSCMQVKRATVDF